jgi:hypothetical protein
VKPELGAKASVLPIIYVAGHHKKLDRSFDAEVDEGVEGLKGCRAQGVRDCGVLCRDPFKRTVEVKVRNVNKGKGTTAHNPA